jgi:hypothetical protein
LLGQSEVERQALQAQLTAERDAHDVQLAAERQALRDHETAALEAEGARIARIRGKSVADARRVGRIMRWVALAVVVVGASAPSIWELPHVHPLWLRVVVSAAVVLAIGFGSYHLLLGTPVNRHIERLEASLARRLEARYKALADPPSD